MSNKINNTLIIAEAGVNHDGNLDKAKQLIEVAADAGADLVKFQTFNARRLVTDSAPKADYQNRTTDEAQSQYEMLRQLEMKPEMHEALITHCQQNGVGFFPRVLILRVLIIWFPSGSSVLKYPQVRLPTCPICGTLVHFVSQ